jgi:transcriptional regulator with XRE-family HTH domain
VARTSPTVRRRRLGQELRTLREAKGLTVDQVAKELDWSPSKVSRIETTSIKVTTVDLRALLDVYEVSEKIRRDGMLELGRESRETAWWMKVNDRTPIRGFKDFIGFEAEARRILTFEPLTVPGLLQTEDYTRAILKAMYTADADMEQAVQQRLERQGLLTRGDEPLLYTAIIDEAALRRPVGGVRRAAVMSEQIDKILAFSERSHVTVLVVPFDNGAHAGMNGGFVILELPHPDDPNVVYVEAVSEATLLSDLESIRYYNQVFDDVQQESLGQEGTRSFLRSIRDSYAAEVAR